LLKLGRVKIDIIPNPVDTKTFFEAQADFQEYILFVGSVCKKKGIEELIDAMKIVWREFPNCRLKVVGRDVIDERYGGSFIAYLKRKINGDHRITFEGAVDHKAIPDFINKAMMCVYPSYMEALPLAWLEALAMGKPFIGSRTGPGPEVVEDGVTGVLVNPRDPKEIAEAILKYLKHPKWSLKIGKNARKHIQKNFEANMLAQVNLDYFNRIKKR
jgi:glycosyltransferase involved in cell wall biosynthesis